MANEQNVKSPEEKQGDKAEIERLFAQVKSAAHGEDQSNKKNALKEGIRRLSGKSNTLFLEYFNYANRKLGAGKSQARSGYFARYPPSARCRTYSTA